MNEHVIDLAHQRDTSYNNFLHKCSDEKYLAYKIARNAVTVAARRAKRFFYYRFSCW